MNDAQHALYISLAHTARQYMDDSTLYTRAMLENALLKLEIHQLNQAFTENDRASVAAELECARLEQLSAVQATQLVALNDERDIARSELLAAHNDAYAQACEFTQEAEQLRARIAELEAQGVTPVEESKPFVCDVCGAGYASASGLGGHRFHAHGLRKAGAEPVTPVDEPTAPIVRIELPADDPHWRCATCGKAEGQPFPRSINDPSRCMHCFSNIAMNGVHA